MLDRIRVQLPVDGLLFWKLSGREAISESSARLMVFTLSAQQAFTAEQTEQWQHLSHSVVLKHASQG
ncbi:hypothetical protein [Rosenbergiella epipactidis]|uniref:hypothetical protein n=1 Tax=Rosenbergiella epipactidis TaxID=1544694 RepID=UPI001F4FE252|nr:hypothetical protein [Rosenbergiella epipactidis]